MTLFRKTLKYKLGFSSSIPNNIIINPYIYGCIDIYQNQLEAKSTAFFIQLNDKGVLGEITNIRLINLQKLLRLTHHPCKGIEDNVIKHYSVIVKEGYLVSMIRLLSKNNIEINIANSIERNIDNYFIEQVSSRKSKNIDKPLFATYNSLSKEIDYYAYKQKATNQNRGTFNHILVDEVKPDVTTFKFCTGCDKNTSLTSTSSSMRINDSLCRNQFNLMDMVSIDNSVTIWPRHRKPNSSHSRLLKATQSRISDNIDDIEKDIIDHFVIQNDNIIESIFEDTMDRLFLTSIEEQLRYEPPHFEAYTDGSLRNNNTPDIVMSYGFIILDNKEKQYRFRSSVTNWPSSTKAEIMAILTTLVVLPENSNITIYTDSQCAIDSYKINIEYNLNFNARKFFKINNNNWA